MSLRVIVIGGGITGLSAAYQIMQSVPSAELTLLESRDRLGGNIVTERRDGFVIDGGPDSFLVTKPDAVRLCAELGLHGELVSPLPEARNVYIVHAGRLERMPAGMVLAVPTRFGPLVHTPLLSLRAKARVIFDLFFRARRTPVEDESIESFIARHFGHEMATRIAGPLLGGIYAGNIAELSIRATFPQLVELERRYGSVIVGFVRSQLEGSRGAAAPAGATPFSKLKSLYEWARREEQRKSPFRSFKNGVGTLIDALAARLPPGSIRLASAASGILREHDRFCVVLESGARLAADALIVTTPAHAAARLMPDPELRRELEGIPYESTATVFFALPRSGVRRALDASGFVVAPKQARLLAATWVTSKWGDRAPSDHVLIRAFVGGARDSRRVAESSDEQLVELARSELEALMGRLGEPSFTRVFRHVRASPQPIVGHRERIARIERRLAKYPGLYLAGAAYDGVGIPDCIRQGRAAAERAVREHATPPRADVLLS